MQRSKIIDKILKDYNPLTPNQTEVLKLLIDGKDIIGIGSLFSVSRQRIAQIEAKIIVRLKKTFKRACAYYDLEAENYQLRRVLSVLTYNAKANSSTPLASFLDSSIISPRFFNIADRHGCKTVGDLVDKLPEVVSARGFGVNKINELKELLKFGGKD